MKKSRGIFLVCTLFWFVCLCGCDSISDEEAIDYSKKFLRDNEYEINYVRRETDYLNNYSFDMELSPMPNLGILSWSGTRNGRVVTFPLDVSKDSLVPRMDPQAELRIVKIMDEKDINTIVIKPKRKFIIILGMRNKVLNNLVLTNYVNISDTTSKPSRDKQYYLFDHWMLYSFAAD